MKKIIAVIIVTVMVMGTAGASYGSGYSDIKSTNWAYEAVNAMSSKSILSGYPDGSFKPGNTVTYGEFIKMALIADSGQDAGNSSSGHWALNYYNKALEQNYFTSYDISKGQLSEPITRGDMALIISSILGDVKIENYDEIQKGIKDITYQTKHEYDITKAYASGILTGYTDSTFRPAQTLTRAESATVIYRLVDESKRELPKVGEAPKENQKPLGEVITNYKSWYHTNGPLDELMAAAETYEFDNDAAKYGMSLKENRGTTWVHVSNHKDLGRMYLMKDGKIVELLALSAYPDGTATAIFKSDITKADYIVSLRDNHIKLIPNPFQK